MWTKKGIIKGYTLYASWTLPPRISFSTLEPRIQDQRRHEYIRNAGWLTVEWLKPSNRSSLTLRGWSKTCFLHIPTLTTTIVWGKEGFNSSADGRQRCGGTEPSQLCSPWLSPMPIWRTESSIHIVSTWILPKSSGCMISWRFSHITSYSTRSMIKAETYDEEGAMPMPCAEQQSKK